MNPNIKTGFAREINEVELSLARTMIVLLEKDAVTLDQSSQIAEFILSEIKKVKNIQELSVFLQTLASKWVFFDTISQLYRLRSKEETDTQQKLEEAKKKLENFV